MLTGAFATWALVSVFSDYPAFLKRGGVIEAYTDRGTIVEMIVRCPVGTGILAYSKVEQLYCSSKHKCSPALRAAVDDTCR